MHLTTRLYIVDFTLLLIIRLELKLALSTYSQVVEVDLKVEGPGENNVHNNAFYAEETLLKSEMQAMRDCSPLTARHWIVRNLLPLGQYF